MTQVRPQPTGWGRRSFWAGSAALAVGCTGAIVTRLVTADELPWRASTDVARVAALVATWLALVLLTWRTGGRTVIVAVFSGVVLSLVGVLHEPWALAAAAVTAGTSYALLGMVMTRPAAGLRALRELVASAAIGLVGGVVVFGYDVELRPFRFRVVVLTLALLCALALAWRLGQGFGSLGRRGVVVITSGVTVIALAVVYTEAVRRWGTPELVDALAEARQRARDTLGADPRPVEVLVGFPALVWGVAVRDRRRQGWWMCAFGALGAGGLTSSLVDPTRSTVDSLAATGYGVLFGGLLGLVVVAIDRILTGPGGRRVRKPTGDAVHRPEPDRLRPVL
jgi:hypothetical protein